jgi:hypothetical protein
MKILSYVRGNGCLTQTFLDGVVLTRIRWCVTVMEMLVNSNDPGAVSRFREVLKKQTFYSSVMNNDIMALIENGKSLFNQLRNNRL